MTSSYEPWAYTPENIPIPRGKGPTKAEIEARPCAVYRLWDADGALLYIGSSPEPRRRWLRHCRTQAWGGEIASWTVEWFDDHQRARNTEWRAIRDELPRHNLYGKPSGTVAPLHGPRRPPKSLGILVGRELLRRQYFQERFGDPSEPSDP